MHDIIPFSFENTEVRAVTDEHGDPWFVASDVATVLGYGHVPHMTRMLDDDEKDVQNLDTPGGKQEMTIISESGLYACILKSRRPEAKVFRKWVTSEVLPTLRKTGRYELPAAPTISPAQQRQLQNAIAERFPEGKHRPYAWSRFNNHFHLGSYKQLPASQTEEALAYIAQMDGATPVPETERARQAREALRFARFQLLFDHNGMMTLHEIPSGAYVMTAPELVRLVGEPGEIDRELLPGLIENAAKRLKKTG